MLCNFSDRLVALNNTLLPQLFFDIVDAKYIFSTHTFDYQKKKKKNWTQISVVKHASEKKYSQ